MESAAYRTPAEVWQAILLNAIHIPYADVLISPETYLAVDALRINQKKVYSRVEGRVRTLRSVCRGWREFLEPYLNRFVVISNQKGQWNSSAWLHAHRASTLMINPYFDALRMGWTQLRAFLGAQDLNNTIPVNPRLRSLQLCQDPDSMRTSPSNPFSNFLPPNLPNRFPNLHELHLECASLPNQVLTLISEALPGLKSLRLTLVDHLKGEALGALRLEHLESLSYIEPYNILLSGVDWTQWHLPSLQSLATAQLRHQDFTYLLHFIQGLQLNIRALDIGNPQELMIMPSTFWNILPHLRFLGLDLEYTVHLPTLPEGHPLHTLADRGVVSEDDKFMGTVYRFVNTLPQNHTLKFFSLNHCEIDGVSPYIALEDAHSQRAWYLRTMLEQQGIELLDGYGRPFQYRFNSDLD